MHDHHSSFHNETAKVSRDLSHAIDDLGAGMDELRVARPDPTPMPPMGRLSLATSLPPAEPDTSVNNASPVAKERHSTPHKDTNGNKSSASRPMSMPAAPPAVSPKPKATAEQSPRRK